MIIVSLRGGLGNQMFQYAAARRLAFIHNTPLRLDVSRLGKAAPGVTQRTFELQNFQIQGRPASRDELLSFSSCAGTWFGSVYSKFLQLTRVRPNSHVFREAQFHFDPKVLDLPDDTCLVGYWQSPRYYAEVEEIIRCEFSPREPLAGRSLELAKRMQGSNSISLHVRRGDYANNHKTLNHHGLCSLDYYRKCVDVVTEKVSSPHFFVFSDDPKWVRDNLRFNFPLTIVEHNTRQDAYKDLILMSLCRHNIIANSTFSWWAAWLNSNPDKLVLAPTRWFAAPSIRTEDLIPDSWTRI